MNILGPSAQQRIQSVLLRCEPVTESLTGEARGHAERIVSVARLLAVQVRGSDDNLIAQAEYAERRKELAQLVELCGRRGAWSIPFATLGRALLADLNKDRRSFLSTCEECEAKLSALGF